MTNTELCKLVVSYIRARNEKKKELPYQLNLLDEIHANENAHTRILVKLLRYEQSGHKIFLENFLTKVNEEIKKGNQESDKFRIQFENENFTIYEQSLYIDCLILSENYAIIIENKINGARDQWEQIQKYIKPTQNRSYQNNKIYVIYLTNDGSKKVSDESFTHWAKEILNYDEENNGRFVPMNYRYHILPLLENTSSDIVQKSEKEVKSEKKLETALFQYIDYLKGRFCMREEEKNYYDNICTELKNNMHVVENLDGVQFYEEVSKIKTDLDSFLDKIKIEPFNKKAEKIKDFYEKNTCNPFFDLEIYFEDTKEAFPIVVFHGYNFKKVAYKLDVMLDLDGALLTLKQENNFLPENQKLIKILKEKDFDENSLTRRIDENEYDRLL